MTANRRIVLNFVATYGRCLFEMACGLFTSRWVLMALGEADFGLYGVVGAITVFIAFFNNILAGSVTRFFALAIGEETKNPEAGLLHCREWFTTALVVHLVVPIVLLAIGYPLGEWAVRNYLTIPPTRVDDCLCVFRLSCIICGVGMMTVPLQAMYAAKQYIAELTIYSFVSTSLNVVFVYYMVSHSGDWFLPFAVWGFVLGLVPQIIIAARAIDIFPECRIIRRRLFDFSAIRHLCAYAGWNFFGATGNLLKQEGVSVLVNRVYGPSRNAALAIAGGLSANADKLSSSLVSAMTPAITAACGAGDRRRLVALLHQTCKFGALLILPFAIPLFLESDLLLKLWLKNPPVDSAILCVCILITLLLEKLSTGHWVAIAANGKIALYQFLVGSFYVATLPLAWGLMRAGCGLISVGYALIATRVIVVAIRIIAVQILLRIPYVYWLRRIFLPVLTVSLIAFIAGLPVRFTMAPSLLRLILTTLCIEIVLLPLAWKMVLDIEERRFVAQRLPFGRWWNMIVGTLRSLRLFGADCRRFIAFAGTLHENEDAAVEARLIMMYHVLEKGITMPERRPAFGRDAVFALLDAVADAEKRFPADNVQLRQAIATLLEYRQLHLAANSGIADDLRARLDAFALAHETSAHPVHRTFTRDEFFAGAAVDFATLAHARHTLRHYSTEPVPAEKIRRAVALAQTAPSACNRQYVHVHCVTSATIRQAIYALQNGNRGFAARADKLLVITADLRAVRWLEERNDPYVNCGIFIMNLVYALYTEHLAHCLLNWSVSPANDAEAHRILALPPNEVIAALICVGNAPEKFEVAASPRRPPEEVLVWHE